MTHMYMILAFRAAAVSRQQSQCASACHCAGVAASLPYFSPPSHSFPSRLCVLCTGNPAACWSANTRQSVQPQTSVETASNIRHAWLTQSFLTGCLVVAGDSSQITCDAVSLSLLLCLSAVHIHIHRLALDLPLNSIESVAIPPPESKRTKMYPLDKQLVCTGTWHQTVQKGTPTPNGLGWWVSTPSFPASSCTAT